MTVQEEGGREEEGKETVILDVPCGDGDRDRGGGDRLVSFKIVRDGDGNYFYKYSFIVGNSNILFPVGTPWSSGTTTCTTCVPCKDLERGLKNARTIVQTMKESENLQWSEEKFGV
jgi:hypothetical protein